MPSNGQLNNGALIFWVEKFIVETHHANLKWLCSIAPHKDKLRHAGYPHLLNTILNYVTALVTVTHSCCPFTLRRNPVYPV